MLTRVRLGVAVAAVALAALPVAASAHGASDLLLRQEYNQCRAEVNAAWLALPTSQKTPQNYSVCDSYRP